MVGLGGAGSEPKKGEKNHPIVESKEHNPPQEKRKRFNTENSSDPTGLKNKAAIDDCYVSTVFIQNVHVEVLSPRPHNVTIWR